MFLQKIQYWPGREARDSNLRPQCCVTVLLATGPATNMIREPAHAFYKHLEAAHLIFELFTENCEFFNNEYFLDSVIVI